MKQYYANWPDSLDERFGSIGVITKGNQPKCWSDALVRSWRQSRLCRQVQKCGRLYRLCRPTGGRVFFTGVLMH
jgi:hypothetical protein